MHHSTLGKLATAALAFALCTAGCQTSGDDATAGTAQERGGKVVDRSQGQTVNPDGTATRTRTQLRQTPSGTTVRETQTEQREVVTPGGSGATTADPTQADPGSAQ